MDPSNLDEILRLLSDQYRRQIIRVLRRLPEDEVAFDALIDGMVSGNTVNGQARDRVVMQLHHTHLPKLRQRGIIEYDPDLKIIRYVGDPDVEAVMERIITQQSRVRQDD